MFSYRVVPDMNNTKKWDKTYLACLTYRTGMWSCLWQAKITQLFGPFSPSFLSISLNSSAMAESETIHRNFSSAFQYYGSWMPQFEDDFLPRGRVFGNIQKFSQTCPTPKYYCFHPGALCKCNANEQTEFTAWGNQGIVQEGHIWLNYQMCPSFWLNCQMCPKTVPWGRNSSLNWGV